MIKAIVFDLDDTLISENEYIQSGFRHVSKKIFREFNKTENQIYNDLLKLFQQDASYVFNRLYEKYEFDYDEKSIKNMISMYRNHIPDISLYQDVYPCLLNLKSKGIKIGMITDGYAITQKNKIESLGIANLFDKIIITDELGREFWKPHPLPFEMMKDSLGVEFNEMVYIGDNPEKDFYIKNTYPITTVRIFRDGVYGNKGYLNKVREDTSIKNLIEIEKILLS